MTTSLVLHAPTQAHASKSWHGQFRLENELRFSPLVEEGEAATRSLFRFVHVQMTPDTELSHGGNAVACAASVKTLQDIANAQVYPWEEHRASLPVNWVWNQGGKWLVVGHDTLQLDQRKLRWLYFSFTDLQRASLAVWLDEMLSQGRLQP